jgi:hypothetical protein
MVLRFVFAVVVAATIGVVVSVDASFTFGHVRSACRWTAVAVPPSGAHSFRHGMAVRVAGDAWIVGERQPGFDPQRAVPLAEHWAGKRWSAVPSVKLPAPAAFSGVAAVGASDVWAVGAKHRTSQRDSPMTTLIEHWNGTVWKVVPSPNAPGRDNSLSAVAAVASNDVWAVGWSRQTRAPGPRHPLLLHWNGSRWSLTTQSLRGALSAVMAVGAHDVWATGQGPFYGENGKVSGLSEHWDGRKWAVLPLVYSSGLGGSGNFLIDLGAVAAAATNDVWAVGWDLSENSYVAHWNGHAWRDVKHPPFGSGIPSVRDVAAFARDDAWAVGVEAMEHWNGRTWSLVRNLPRTGLVFNMVDGASPSDIWAISDDSFLHYRC